MQSGGKPYVRFPGGQWELWQGDAVPAPPAGPQPGGPPPAQLPPGASDPTGTNPPVPEAGEEFYPNQQLQGAPGQTFSAAPAAPAPDIGPQPRPGLAAPVQPAAHAAQPGQISRTTGGFRMADGTAGRVDGQDNVVDASGKGIGRLQRDQDGQVTGFLLNTGQFVPMAQTWNSI